MHWDRETYPYLVSVSWAEVGGPLVTVLRRLQQHGLVLAIEPRTGETQVHAELADPRWVEPIAGTPRYLPDGRVLIGGELAHDGYDARCLFADGSLLTPTSLYVRRVCGTARVRPAGRGERGRAERAAPLPGQHAVGPGAPRCTGSPPTPAGTSGPRGGDDHRDRQRASLDHAGAQWTVLQCEARTGRSADEPRPPRRPYAPRPALERVTDRRLPTGVLYPRSHVTGRRLPVLVDIYGGPGHQEVIAARSRWQERQWWADAGFAVVVIDNRGTPGVRPVLREGDPPPAGRRDPHRPGRRAAPRWPTSTPTST